MYFVINYVDTPISGDFILTIMNQGKIDMQHRLYLCTAACNILYCWFSPDVMAAMLVYS